MALRRLAALLVLAALAAPTVAAAHRPPCSEVTDDSEPVDGRYYRLHQATVQQWSETNSLAGLQRQACTDTGGVHRPADRHDGSAGVGGGCLVTVNGWCLRPW